MSNGLMPNSDLRKNTLSAKFGYKLNDKLTANVYSTLTLQNVKGRNETGYSDNILSGFRQWWQTNVDVLEQKDVYFNSGGLNDIGIEILEQMEVHFIGIIHIFKDTRIINQMIKLEIFLMLL